MRLFLLPVSTRRTLIYCERVQEAVQGAQQPISERIINKASQTWAQWEKAERGWQKKLTVYGNQLFMRIPYEEWGLKSIPPATKRKLQDVDEGKIRFECLYPGAFMKQHRVPEILQRLATERQSFHKKKMWTSLAWIPATLPFAVVPIVPNIPFFYLCFRAYSHFRALYGGRLLEHLVRKSLVTTTDSQQMDELYAAGLLHPNREGSRGAPRPSEDVIQTVAGIVEAQTNGGKEDVMMLQRWNGKLIAEDFHLPEMEIEIERAVEQVEQAIKQKDELAEEKKEVMEAKVHETEKFDDSKR
ncbi:hypothetical protein D0869_02011 [Hortaea werneckii]|uniref:Mitochondrial K+-H+ exchange-related-domain-containing protein n=1 Tax=Hortaea werneckii TaxID=91943 RepID=A0A3M7BRT5_HORWE|nr:hypothetical protein KC334_g7869 [Hortaea werneckii]KAI7026778.1 hypothetical protein KC355_g529 [Hortaea werneckii]KAI7134458.1 hypothetical protein KC324_g16775 [Hortaea werneckii]KAI7533266.1 hypothetical protein KC316_g16808 [Hortaea werneckii]KAI7665145.1 hypothetical protein KC318_g7291 [Hortaea werneckii]